MCVCVSLKHLCLPLNVLHSLLVGLRYASLGGHYIDNVSCHHIADLKKFVKQRGFHVMTF